MSELPKLRSMLTDEVLFVTSMPYILRKTITAMEDSIFERMDLHSIALALSLCTSKTVDPRFHGKGLVKKNKTAGGVA